MSDVRKYMNEINNLIDAVKALQAVGVGVEIDQLEDGRFDVGVSLDMTDISINASYPEEAVTHGQ